MKRRIAVAGTGHVGLSLAILLVQKNTVTAVDIVSGKVELINQKISPIRDEYIENTLPREIWIYLSPKMAQRYVGM